MIKKPLFCIDPIWKKDDTASRAYVLVNDEPIGFEMSDKEATTIVKWLTEHVKTIQIKK